MKHDIILANDCEFGSAGQKVSLELTPSDVHDPTELPTYLAGFRPFGMRADEASPPILVDNDEDKFRTFSEDDTFRRVKVKGATTAAIPEVDPNTSLRTYKVVDRFVGSFVPKVTEMQTGNNYRPRQAAARRCQRAIMLDRELDVFRFLLGDLNNWDTSVRTAAANPWTDATLGTPIVDLQTAIEKSHQPVSAIWLNQKIAHAFVRHPEVRDHMRQFFGDSAPAVGQQLTQAAVTGDGTDFAIPGFPPFRVVASKIKNDAGALEYVFPDVVALVTVPQAVPEDGEEVATTYTFRRRGPSGVGFETREFVHEGRGPHGGTMVVVSVADSEQMTGNTCGGIITAVA